MQQWLDWQLRVASLLPLLKVSCHVVFHGRHSCLSMDAICECPCALQQRWPPPVGNRSTCCSCTVTGTVSCGAW